MKILFVVNDCLTMPLGVGYLGAYARRAGHDVRLCAMLHDDPVSVARAFGADVVGFTATTGIHKRYLAMARALKESLPGTLTVMGGAHPTFFPEVLEQNPCLDAICLGEGEEAFEEFLGEVSGGRDAASVRNFWVRKPEGGIARNPLRPLISDLDSIPFPERSMWEVYGEKMTFKTPFVITSRGCPYRCSYCFNHAYNRLYSFDGRVVRRRSVQNVIEELKLLKSRYELGMVVFQDDIFILDRDWVLEFGQRYRTEIGVPFHCHLRANLVSPDIVGALSEAGCVSIKMAIESADETIRNGILKRGMSLDQILSATRMVREAGIVLVTQNILGNPGESLDKALQTLDLNIRCRPGFAFATLLQPYPRTEIGEYAREHGLLVAEPSQADHTSFFDASMLRLEHPERFERLRMLFAIVVENPWLRRLLPALLRLPLGPVYGLVDKLWKGFAVKHREMPYRLTFREYIRSVRTYLSTGYY
jgi:anaerobic magnesium-protoporphyrin IX monomethyl ester cyclase